MGRKRKLYQENDKIINIYNNKTYSVVFEIDGLVKVKDKENNFYIMASVDTKRR